MVGIHTENSTSIQKGGNADDGIQWMDGKYYQLMI